MTSSSVPIPEAAIEDIAQALQTFPIPELREQLVPAVIEGAIIAAPYIDRAARVDVLRKLKNRALRDGLDDDDYYVMVRDIDRMLAELEAQK